MSIWDAAGAAINAAFADPEPLVYTCAGKPPVSLRAIRSEHGLDDGTGRRIVFEIADTAGLPAAPTKRDNFSHRGRLYAPEQIVRRDDVAAWQLTVSDQGAAA